MQRWWHQAESSTASDKRMYKNVLLSVDLGDTKSSEESVNAAVAHVRAFGSTLRLMTVVPDFGMSIVGLFFPAEHKTTMLEAA